jgi:hypothetical protein
MESVENCERSSGFYSTEEAVEASHPRGFRSSVAIQNGSSVLDSLSGEEGSEWCSHCWKGRRAV